MKILYGILVIVFMAQTACRQVRGDGSPYIATIKDVIILAKSQSFNACQAQHQFSTAGCQYRSAKGGYYRR